MAIATINGGGNNGMPTTVMDRPKDPMSMFGEMFRMMEEMRGRLDLVLGPPADDYFGDELKNFTPNYATKTKQSPPLTVPPVETKIYTHAIAADPLRDRIFVYTGNYFFTTAPMLAVVLAAYGGVGTVLANFDQDQMMLNSDLQNYSICPSLIKITPQVVGALQVAFFQSHPVHNNPISVSYPLQTFVQNSQFQANIVDLPYGFKLGADVLMAVPVPANTTTTILMTLQKNPQLVVK